MNRLEDKDLVKCCVAELSEKMGYADATVLSQRDYEHLCESIEEKTGILISLSTIKRIFAGKFERLPQAATLNALTVFLGYAGWQDYKTRKRLELPRRPLPSAQPLLAEPPPPKAVAQGAVRQKRVAPFLKATALLLLVSLGVLVFFLATKQKEQPDAPAGEVAFSARKAVSQGVPNSVVFSYNVDHVAADSFFIQQSWDPSRRVPISKKTYTQTDIYYEPGYHRAKLIADGRVLKETSVSIPAEGWMAYNRLPAGKLPQYIGSPIIGRGRLGVNPGDLPANGIDPQKDGHYFFSFFPPVPAGDGDDFTLKTRLRLQTLKPTHCPKILVCVYCANGVYYFKNTIPGCISEIDALLGDTYLSGKKHDLSGLGVDVSDWYDVEMSVHGKRVKLLVDGKLVLEAPYGKPAGPIQGLSFVSTGLCEADEVTVLNAAGEAIYHDDFNAVPPATAVRPATGPDGPKAQSVLHGK